MADTHPLVSLVNTDRYESDLRGTVTRIKEIAAGSSSHAPSSGTDVEEATEELNELIMESRSPTRKELRDKINSIGDKAKNRILEILRAQFDPDTQVKIGTIITSVPPESILIQEQKTSEWFHGLRSQSHFQVKTGKGAIRISFPVQFPNLRSINEELRHIVGQFRTSPLIPLESRYIYDAVHGKLVEERAPEANKAMVNRLFTVLTQENKARLDLKDFIETVCGVPVTFDIGSMTAREVAENVRALRVKTEDTVGPVFLRNAGAIERSLSTIASLETDRLQLSRSTARKAIQSPRLTNALPIVPVVFDAINISSVPGFSERLEAEFSFYVFNHIPYTNYVLYRDVLGGWTPAIDRCLLWRNYYTARMGPGDLNLRPMRREQYAEHAVLSYPCSDDSLQSAIAKVDPKVYRYPNVRDTPRKSITIPISGGLVGVDVDWYIQSVSIGMNYLLPRIPILSGQYPVFQSMGSSPARATLRIMAKHDKIGEIHTIKRSVDRLMIDSGGRAKRAAFLEIQDPLFKLCGQTQWQLDNITTYTVDTEWSSVELTLTSFNFPKDEEPKLIESASGRTTYDRIKHAWERILELSKDYENSLQNIQDRKSRYGTLAVRKAIQALNGTPEEEAWEALLGSPTAIISEDLLKALYAVHPNAFGKVVSSLNTAGIPTLRLFGLLDGFTNEEAKSSLPVLREGSTIPQGSNQRTFANRIVELTFNLLTSKVPPGLGRAANPAWRVTLDDPTVAELRPFLLSAMMNQSIVEFILPRTNDRLREYQDKTENLFGQRISLGSELGKLVSIVLGNTRFQNLSNKLRLEDIRNDSTDQTNPYPDLNLPTYGQVHRDYLEALKTAYDASDLKAVSEKVSPTIGLSSSTLVKNWIETLPNPAFVNGANTLAQDGRSEVLPENANRVSYNADQRVDPDFYFYSVGSREVLDEVFEGTVLPEAAQFQFGTFSKAEEEIKNILKDSSKDENNLRTGPSAISGSPEKRGVFKPESGEPALNPFTEEYATQTDLVTKLTGFNPAAPGQIQNFLTKAIQSVKDDRHRLSKFFPAYQLFFIHEERGLLVRYSDWYGYNAIIDLHVTRHKWQPDVAQFTIANPLGYLDDTKFNPRLPEERIKLSKDQEADSVRRSYRGDSIQDPADSDRIDSLILREGVRIVIKMGFSSRTGALETVFTGKIAELEQGDVVNVVAQGYAGELGFPIQEDEKIDLDNTWKLMKERLGIGTSRPHKILTLVHEVLSRQPTENLGDWGIGDVVNRSKISDKGNLVLSEEEEGRNVLTRLSGESRIGRLIRALFTDPKLENVGGLWATSLTKDFREGNLLDLKSKWTLEKDMTGLQVLREITLMFPGHCFSVLPYDERATLFLGRPESLYYHTSSGRTDRITALSELSAEANVSLDDGVVTGFFDRLFSGLLPRDGEVPEVIKQAYELVNNYKKEEPFGSPEYLDAQEFSREYAEYLRLQGTDELASVDVYTKIRELLEQDRKTADSILPDYASVLGDNSEAAEALVKIFISFLGFRSLQGEDTLDLVVGEQSLNLDWGDLPDILVETPASRFLLTSKEEISILWDSRKEAAPPPLDKLAKHKVSIRRHLRSFLEYMRRKGTLTPSADLLRNLKAKAEKARTRILDGTKPFRRFHFLDSIHDIIANNIIATRGVMKNVIRINGSGGEQDWKTVAIDDDLKIGDYLIGHVRSPNADRPALMYLAGYGHLAEAMRPMYRGELIIRGNPDIKPWDVCFLYDIHSKIWGPIEVERVTHSFSYETGFTTTITPHLYCTATNEVDWASTTLAGMAIGTAGALAIGAGAVLSAPLLAPVAGLLGATGSIGLGVSAFIGYNITKDLGDWISETLTGTSVYGLICGRGFLGREENPVMIVPLILNGEPFVAAMNGFDKDGKFVGLKLAEKKLQWFRRGVARTLNDISIGMEKISESTTRIMDVGQ